MAFNCFRFAQRHGRFCVRQGKRAGLHLSERLFDKLLYFGRLYVAKHKNDAVLCDDVTITKLQQIFLRQPLSGLDRAV